MVLTQGELQKRYIWQGGTQKEIKKVTIRPNGSEIQIRPTIKDIYIDFLLIGGGGGGGYGCSQVPHGGGGGAGGVIQCCNYLLSENTCVKIGNGGGSKTKGGDSCFGDIIAYGGGRGADNTNSAGSGGSGGGGGMKSTNLSGGAGCSGQGHNGGTGNTSYGSGGGGGAGGNGGNAYYSNRHAYSGNGGIGITSDIDGTTKCYAGGGGGGRNLTSTYNGSGCYGGGNGGGCNATTYGSGGGGGGAGGAASGGSGCQGIFIARYPSDCGYNVSGGCKYECNGYCIHCFTSNGTLTIN